MFLSVFLLLHCISLGVNSRKYRSSAGNDEQTVEVANGLVPKLAGETLGSRAFNCGVDLARGHVRNDCDLMPAVNGTLNLTTAAIIAGYKGWQCKSSAANRTGRQPIRASSALRAESSQKALEQIGRLQF